jgi:uncharacterized protein YyaL (SSP411 family)
MYSAAMEETRSAGPLSPTVLDAAFHALERRYDEQHGGFEGAPKFPQTMSLDFLLRYAARNKNPRALEMVTSSFRHMAQGGIYDQIAGGFARYTVDAVWLVPHFEKMLYDNALLVRLGAHVWQATKDAEVRRVVEQTIDWAIRELRSPDGGFYSSFDADSEGHEGKFYVWSADEFDALLGDDAPVARTHWGVTDEGNFEGDNILFVAMSTGGVAKQLSMPESDVVDAVSRARATLYSERAKRVWPGRDEKILTSWNALMVRGIAEAARAFENDAYRDVAIESALFLFRTVCHDGRVLRSYKDGQARIAGYLEDYAALGLAALAVYELTFDSVWLDRAKAMSDATVRWFWSNETGAFHDTASDHETLITRPREIADNAVPSGTSLAVDLLVRLAELLHDVDARRRATYVLETLAPAIARYPSAFGHALGVADMLINGAVELAIIGDVSSEEFVAMRHAVATRYVPSLVIAGGAPRTDEPIALLAGRDARGGSAAAYVCRGYTCDEPATSADMLARQLDAL